MPVDAYIAGLMEKWTRCYGTGMVVLNYVPKQA
jgi:hypothetical protein